MPEYTALRIIFLTTATSELTDIIADCEPDWDDDWKDRLKDAFRDVLKFGGDRSTAESWHRLQKALLFLRLELERRELAVFVRDPNTDRELALQPEHWTHLAPKSFIATAPFDNFLLAGSFSVARPDGSRFEGRMDAAYAWSSDFETWMRKRKLVRRPQADWQKSAVKQAVHSLWPERPPDMKWSARNEKINEWLAHNEFPKVSDATIRRALREIYGR